MYQGKLEMVKQEMASVNIDILGISELKWTGMGEFNSNDIISTTGQESLRRNEVGIIVNKSPKCSSVQFSLVPQLCLTLCDPMNLSMPGQNAVLGCNLKNNRMIRVPFQGKPFNIKHNNPSLCPNQ